MELNNAENMVLITRSGMTESIHRGHIAIVNLQGQRLASLGCPDQLIFARSAAKPLQAIPVVESGAIERFHLADDEIAVICSSHNGEDMHVHAVASILAKLGLSAEELTCGIHYPYHKAAENQMRANQAEPSALHNNCSGKHAGMLALALTGGGPLQPYASPEHRVQQQMLRTIAEMSGTNPDHIRLGVDGCGVPVYGLPLDRLALAYARLGNPATAGLPDKRAAACKTIIDALRRSPEMIAGRDRFDTQLIEATDGQIIGKMGAEGVFALTIPSLLLGMAVKVEDGSMRGLYPAVLEALRQMDLISVTQLQRLDSFHRPAVLNHQDRVVGHVEPVFTLHRN